MGHPIRHYPPGVHTYEVVAKCCGDEMLMRPSPMALGLIALALSEACKEHPSIRVVAFTFLSNHYHMLLQVADDRDAPQDQRVPQETESSPRADPERAPRAPWSLLSRKAPHHCRPRRRGGGRPNDLLARPGSAPRPGRALRGVDRPLELPRRLRRERQPRGFPTSTRRRGAKRGLVTRRSRTSPRCSPSRCRSR